MGKCAGNGQCRVNRDFNLFILNQVTPCFHFVCCMGFYISGQWWEITQCSEGIECIIKGSGQAESMTSHMRFNNASARSCPWVIKKSSSTTGLEKRGWKAAQQKRNWECWSTAPDATGLPCPPGQGRLPPPVQLAADQHFCLSYVQRMVSSSHKSSHGKRMDSAQSW